MPHSTTKLMATAALPLAALGALTACSQNPSLSAAGSHDRNAGGGFAAAPIGVAITQPGLGSMTVTKVRCGLTSVPYGAPRTADGMPGVAHAAPGRQICALDATFTNTGAAALAAAPFSSLVASDGHAYPEETTLSTMVATYSPEHVNAFRVAHPTEPGQSAAYRAYFQVPAAATPASIGWPGTASVPAGTFVLG